MIFLGEAYPRLVEFAHMLLYLQLLFLYLLCFCSIFIDLYTSSFSYFLLFMDPTHSLILCLLDFLLFADILGYLYVSKQMLSKHLRLIFQKLKLFLLFLLDIILIFSILKHPLPDSLDKLHFFMITFPFFLIFIFF